MKNARWIFVALVLFGAGHWTRADEDTIEQLLPKAQGGDVAAMNRVGELYEEKDEASPDALKWFRAAAEKGHAAAAANLGFMLYNGFGVDEPDAKAAFPWLLKAAQAGNPLGMRFAAILYDEGAGTPENPAEALRWRRKVAELGGVPRDAFVLARMLADGRGTKPDWAEAMKWMQRAADQGDEDAQSALPDLRQSDPDALAKLIAAATPATKQLQARAATGEAAAQLELGKLFLAGQGGLPQREREGARWIGLAAEKGLAPAQDLLGVLYHDGTGIDVDQVRSVEWHRRAADRKFADAQFHLGQRYQDGDGVDASDVEAIRWYRLAAEQDHVDALLALVSTRVSGLVKPEEVREWWERAAALRPDDATIARELGEYYRDKRDTANALKWLERAQAKGDTGAASLVAELKQVPAAPAPLTKEERAALDAAAARVAAENAAGVPHEVPAPKVIMPTSEAEYRALLRAGQPTKNREQVLADFEYEFEHAPDLARRKQAIEKFSADASSANLDEPARTELVLRTLAPKITAHPAEMGPYLLSISTPARVRELLDATLGPATGAAAREYIRKFVADGDARSAALRAIYPRIEAAKAGNGAAALEVAQFYQTNEYHKDLAEALKWYRAAAAAGDVEAKKLVLQVGWGCADAGTKADREGNSLEAYRQFLLSAENGSGEGKTALAELYLEGDGVRKDVAEGLKWLRSAADDRYPVAQAALAEYHRTGQYVEKNPAEARRYALQAAGQEDPMGWTELGIQTLLGVGTAPDEGEALKHFKAAAPDDRIARDWVDLLERTNLKEDRAELALLFAAQTFMGGEAHRNGRARDWLDYAVSLDSAEAKRVAAGWNENPAPFAEPPEDVAAQKAWDAKNYAEALKFYTITAGKGSTRAMFRIAALYQQGEGVGQDFEVARQWYEKAGRAGYLPGAYNEHIMRGAQANAAAWAAAVAGNDELALAKWREAAGLGVSEARMSLGEAYEKGVENVLPRDLAQAKIWYQRAATLQPAGASVALARMKARETGAKEYTAGVAATAAGRFAEALDWYQKAAALGNYEGMQEMADRYQLGGDVAHDPAKALEFHRKLAALGDEGAIETLKGQKMLEQSGALAARLREAQKLADIADGKVKPTLAPPASAPPPAAARSPADEHFDRFETLATFGPSEEALTVLKKALAVAETGRPETRYRLSSVLFQGTFGLPRDEKRAHALLVSAAKDGFAPAQLGQAQAMLTGTLGFSLDLKQGMTLLTSVIDSAESHEPETQYQTGLILIRGAYGVPVNRARGLRLLKAAAEGGMPQAQADYGQALLVGMPPDLAPDPAQGVDLLKKAAAKQISGVYAVLGQAYERGLGVPADQEQALRWYKKADEAGIPGAREAIVRVTGKPVAAPATKPAAGTGK